MELPRMQSRLARPAKITAIVGALAAPATAQWSENFDSYPPGTPLSSLPEFGHPSGVVQMGNTVSAMQANSGANSARVIGSSSGCTSCSDTICWLGRQSTQTPYASGRWVLRTMTYVPAGLTDLTYFIGLNVYSAGAVGVEWGIQTHFNPATADVTDDGAIGAGSGAEPIAFDTWVPLEYLIDLDLDTVECFYNGNLLFSRTWSGGVFGNNASVGTPLLQAVNLFPLSGASEVFYDDMSLTLPGQNGPTQYCDGVVNSSGSAATIQASGSAGRFNEQPHLDRCQLAGESVRHLYHRPDANVYPWCWQWAGHPLRWPGGHRSL